MEISLEDIFKPGSSKDILIWGGYCNMYFVSQSFRYSKTTFMELQDDQTDSWKPREHNVWNVLTGNLQTLQARGIEPLWTQYRGIILKKTHASTMW